jgi:ubiquinol-cytochrome c reductase cytochrome b subunit
MALRIYQWLDSRLRLKSIRKTLLDEPIPGGASWIYVFGSATLFLFMLQAITGMFLAVYYAPTPDHAYDSIQFIEGQVTFGAFVRGLHHWGASAMVVAIGLHMLQTFLYGAYKPPREVMWMVGIALFLVTLGFAFTGYLLPWDQNAYWATQVGINMVGTIPLIGDFLVRVLRGGQTLGALTLSRFFAVHVLFLPALLLFGVQLHLFILRRVGPAGPWSEERANRGSETFHPRQVYMDAVVMLIVFFVVSTLALTVTFPLADKANPSDTTFAPVPEWYFLFYYQLLKYVHGPLEPFATWILPGMVVLVLLFWPFIDRNPSRHPTTRPVALAAGGVFLIIVFALLGVSLRDLYALPRTDPTIARGQALYAKFGCGGCHRIHGEGGAAAPDLSYVGDRRPERDWHIRHFRDPQSVSPGSFMPKFPLDEQQLNDLTGYVLSLKRGETEARQERPGAAMAAGATSASTAPTEDPTALAPSAASIGRDPTDLSPPGRRRPSQVLRVDLEAVELEGHLAEETTYTYMTFNGKVPGPLIRVQVDDTVELHLKNRETSRLTHSIDLHAVTGPGGGSDVLQVPSGQEKALTFKALKPGVFVYHCATPMIAEHIAGGMYGLIVVEPKGGLPRVDREFYVMQGELYTEQRYGDSGRQRFSRPKLLAETPEYFVLNGAVDVLTKDYPLRAKVGETVRIFFGVGGPNLISSFHVIGEQFDRVYNQASLTSRPLTDVQTTVVAPGGATMVELKLEVPGRFLLVDHALSRMEKGLLGFLDVDGPENLALFRAGGSPPIHAP